MSSPNNAHGAIDEPTACIDVAEQHDAGACGEDELGGKKAAASRRMSGQRRNQSSQQPVSTVSLKAAASLRRAKMRHDVDAMLGDAPRTRAINRRQCASLHLADNREYYRLFGLRSGGNANYPCAHCEVFRDDLYKYDALVNPEKMAPLRDAVRNETNIPATTRPRSSASAIYGYSLPKNALPYASRGIDPYTLAAPDLLHIGDLGLLCRVLAFTYQSMPADSQAPPVANRRAALATVNLAQVRAPAHSQGRVHCPGVRAA